MPRLLAVVCRAILAAAGAAAVSCAQLAGIENTVGLGDSIAVTRMSIGSSVVRAAFDPAGFSATYFVASSDSTGFKRVSAVPDPSHGRLTTTLRMPVPVELTLPEPTPIPRLYAFPSPQLSVLYGVLEHPNPQPAPMDGTLAVNVMLDAAVVAGQSFQAYVVGAWLQRGLSAAEAPVDATQLTPAFAFTTANSVSGRLQVDQVTADDAFLILRYVGPDLTGVAQVPPFAQNGMTTTAPTAAMMPVTHDRSLNTAISPSELSARYAKVVPPVATLQMSWSLVAAPGYNIASNSGPVLQSGGLMMTDGGMSVSYGNPFAGNRWNTIFTLATSESRVFMAPLGPMGALLPVNLQAGMNQFLEPPSPMPASPVSLDLPAGLPQAITIGTTVLASDNAFIKQPNRFIDVSFTVDDPPSAAGQSPTLYNLQLFDLVFNPATMAVDRVLVLAAASKDPAFSLPPALFEVGHSYTLRALATLGGYPAIDQGDFTQRQLPLAQSYLDSGVFTVVMP